MKESRQESLSEICALFNLKQDAYYNFTKRYEIKEEELKKNINFRLCA